MQSKTALILLVAFFATVTTLLTGFSIGFELCSDRPNITTAAVIVACMAIASWGYVYHLFFIDVEAEAKQVDPALLAYQKQKEEEHASFLAWQSDKEAKEKAAFEAYQQRNKYSC